MKILIILITLIPIMAMANCGNNSTNFCNVKSTDVYDGDTIFVDIPKLHKLFSKHLGVRVYGVDTPEIRSSSEYEKAMGQKAKQFTKDLLAPAKRVDLMDCKKGKYFRIVCKVIIDGKISLSDELLKAGLAVEYLK